MSNTTKTPVQFVPVKDLLLDYANPRLSEFGIDKQSQQKEIVQVLWDEMALKELIYSIISDGFWEYEPLIVLQNGDKFIVLEGNRRLAAVMLIHDHSLIEQMPEWIAKEIGNTHQVVNQLREIPVIIVQSREDAWRFIGFKHVNGPAKWGSFAKAKYVAEIHNEYGIPLQTIAHQIGDKNRIVQRLYQALMVLKQARDVGVYSYEEDIQARRIYFSHLYVGLQSEGIKQYLNLKPIRQEAKSPVPKTHYRQLGQLLEWLYGSRRNETQPLIRSQNPDLGYLDEALRHREATIALEDGVPLDVAYELSRPSSALFEENLVKARISLQKAYSHLTIGYSGEETLLRTAGTVAELADALYEEMEKMYVKQRPQQKRVRLTD